MTEQQQVVHKSEKEGFEHFLQIKKNAVYIQHLYAVLHITTFLYNCNCQFFMACLSFAHQVFAQRKQRISELQSSTLDIDFKLPVGLDFDLAIHTDDDDPSPHHSYFKYVPATQLIWCLNYLLTTSCEAEVWQWTFHLKTCRSFTLKGLSWTPLM